MDITVERLIRAGVGPTQARTFAAPMRAACDRFEINTPGRLGAFLGQVRVESASLTRLEENLFYTTPERLMHVWPSRFPSLSTAIRYVRDPRSLANRVYANRGGNRDEASGDGWKYRGRGCFQLTLHDNYLDAECALGRPYTTEPDLVALPEDAMLTSAWYWHSRKCNLLADAWSIDAITRSINGSAMLEAATRRQFSDQAAEAFR